MTTEYVWKPVFIKKYTPRPRKHEQVLSVSNTRIIVSALEKDLTGFYRVERAGNLPIFRLAPVNSGTIEIRPNGRKGQYCYSTAFCTILRSVYKVSDDTKTAHIDYRIDKDKSIIIGEKLAAQICKENAS